MVIGQHYDYTKRHWSMKTMNFIFYTVFKVHDGVQLWSQHSVVLKSLQGQAKPCSEFQASLDCECVCVCVLKSYLKKKKYNQQQSHWSMKDTEAFLKIKM